jgi:hypothetical protein
MVEETIGFKTKYGSVWPTLERAEAEERIEHTKAFINEFCLFGKYEPEKQIDKRALEKTAYIILKNPTLIKELIVKYDI